MGPLKQLKRMFEPTRLIATIVMLVCVFLYYFPLIFPVYYTRAVPVSRIKTNWIPSCPTALPRLNAVLCVLGESFLRLWVTFFLAAVFICPTNRLSFIPSVEQKRTGYHLLHHAVFGHDVVSVTGLTQLRLNKLPPAVTRREPSVQRIRWSCFDS